METKINVRGLSGLNNIGNTCYMNSALQCISASDIFVSYLLKKKFVGDLKDNIIQDLANIEREKKKKKGKYTDDDDLSVYLKDVKKKYYSSLIYNSYKLFKTMWKNNARVTPRTFKNILGESCATFRGYSQQDSQEFINFMLDKIHEEIKTDVTVKYKNIPTDIVEYMTKRKEMYSSLKFEEDISTLEENLKQFEIFKNHHAREETIYKSLDFWDSYIQKNYSPIIDLFTGLFISEITCSKCNNKSRRFEPFNTLPLEIPDKATNLKDCLDEFGKLAKLDGDNKYQCDICKEKNDAEKKMFFWDLPELMIIQFKRFNNNGRSTRKDTSSIKFPFENLTFENNYHEFRPRNYKYNLYGVVYHMGSLNGGHYIAYTQNPINNKWYKYNDASVHHVPDDKIERELMDGGSYILFYKKVYKSSDTSLDEFGDSDGGFTSEEDVN
jgi:ubiquitin carboxyl-terminal hydrolase 8